MTEEERREYWERLSSVIWEATQRPRPSVTPEEISALCEKAFRAFYAQLWLDLPDGAIKAIREANAAPQPDQVSVGSRISHEDVVDNMVTLAPGCWEMSWPTSFWVRK